MRGERRDWMEADSPFVGSSPHARGTPSSDIHRLKCRRIIPACAGNASKTSRSRCSSPDHPRMRGERGSFHTAYRATYGSSPHARGTRSVRRADTGRGRIIPACAGNAGTGRILESSKPDHPRMRGERALTVGEILRTYGSSPHARGTRDPPELRQGMERIIPACAGNAIGPIKTRLPSADHPRMRGERREQLLRPHCVRGSSPHARGTLPFRRGEQVRVRIIPACAGNAAASSLRHRPASDHPRMRGERLARNRYTGLVTGSSPHARGTPHQWRIVAR